jgi:hypothetical protein
MRLAISFAGKKKTHFLDLGIKSYGCLKFQGEVWAGWACDVANEKELTTLQMFWEQGGWAGGGGQGVSMLGDPHRGGRRPRPDQQSAAIGHPDPTTATGGDQRLPASHGPPPVQTGCRVFFKDFLAIYFFLVF